MEQSPLVLFFSRRTKKEKMDRNVLHLRCHSLFSRCRNRDATHTEDRDPSQNYIYPKYHKNSNESCTFVVFWVVMKICGILLKVAYLQKVGCSFSIAQISKKNISKNYPELEI